MTNRIILIVVVTLAIVLVVSIMVGDISQKLKYPVKGRLTSKFGNRTHPISGAKSFHNGIDLAAPSGTPILAPADGTIAKRYYHSAGGNTIIMKHDNGFQTGYAHLLNFNVEVGDKVKQGEKIGEVGSTGGSTGPHLHLTVRDAKGTLVDPLTVLV